MTASEARAATDRFKRTAQVAVDQLIDLYVRQAWAALGHASWEAFCDAELASHVQLGRDQRPDVVVALRQAGMSMRGIASGLDVDRKTVRRDLAQAQGPREPAVTDTEVTDTEVTDTEVTDTEVTDTGTGQQVVEQVVPKTIDWQPPIVLARAGLGDVVDHDADHLGGDAE